MGKNKYSNKTNYINFRVTAAALIVGAALLPSSLRAQVISVAPANMPRIGTVDERFQSFNVEMLEVTGGKFWKPYKDLDAESKAKPATNQSSSSTPAGMDPGMYKYRPPIDLTNSRLRRLAAALAPAYMRVSGTWANTTYFHDADTAAPTTPPKGFDGVLTRQQWKGVVDFSRAVDAKIITPSPPVRELAMSPASGLQLKKIWIVAHSYLSVYLDQPLHPPFYSLSVLPRAFVFTGTPFGADFFLVNFLEVLPFLASFFVGATFLSAVLLNLVCFFLVFFFAAIDAVYTGFSALTKPRFPHHQGVQGILLLYEMLVITTSDANRAVLLSRFNMPLDHGVCVRAAAVHRHSFGPAGMSSQNKIKLLLRAG